MRKNSICLAVFLALGCRKSDVTVYRVSKDNAPAGAETAAAGGGLRWEIPPGWTRRPADGIRKASFAVAGKSGEPAEVSVVALPGDAGGVLPNVNRWRGQLGLTGISDAELSGEISRLKSRAGDISLVDLSGDADGRRSRIIAAILPARGGTWFVKMTGEPAVVGQAKPAFRRFLGSLHFEND